MVIWPYVFTIMSWQIKLIYGFFILFVFVFLSTLLIIKPLLAYRLKHNPPKEYNEWFVVNSDNEPLKIKRDLSSFVREKYRTTEQDERKSCRSYLHVFAHTTAGKPLALLFDAKGDTVIETRYLDDPIDPTNWRYKPHINNRCIERIDDWRDYFLAVPSTKNPTSHTFKKQGLSDRDSYLIDNMTMASPMMRNSPLAMLASRYQYHILYNTRFTASGQQRFIVIQFTDIFTSRSWNFELTGVNWNVLLKYADKSTSDTATITNNDNDDSKDCYAIKRLQRLIPISWLTRLIDVPELDVIGASIGSNNNDPCWSDTHGRSVVGKRSVTLSSFYYHYLRGLQLPSANEARSLSIKDALSRMYFDCYYDKGTTSTLPSPNDNQSSLSTHVSSTDATLYHGTSDSKRTVNISEKGNINYPHCAPISKNNICTVIDRKKHVDEVLYRVVPFLRICDINKHFDELLQICK